MLFEGRINQTNDYRDTPRSRLSQKHDPKVERPLLSEWGLAVLGLVMSLLVIAAKVIAANGSDIKQFFLEKQLEIVEIASEDGRIVYSHAWKNVVKYSHLWLPILCGSLTTYFTWMMVYLDSAVPGVQPPSPFSPTKYKTRSGHSFHLNYLLAVFIGILVSVYMYWRNVSIQYY